MQRLRFVPPVRVLILFAFLLFFVFLSVPTTAAHPARHNLPTLADLPPAAQSLVSATLGRDDAAYQFQAMADGYRTTNASNTLRADFSNLGMRLESDGAQWTMALQAVGYGDALETVSQVAPTAVANRLEYTHDTFTEWYVNGPAGLEQGWTLNTPPASCNGSALTLALALEGNARLDASGQAVELLRDDGTTALRYTSLVAYDATGRELRAWLEFAETLNLTSLHIRVDDTGAQYPLTIDPYVLQATLSNSGGVANDQLGLSIAISADGSTIVAGAPGVSSNKGAAYVFVKPGNNWMTDSVPNVTLTNLTGAVNDYLGYAVAINSNGAIIVVGAYGVNSAKGVVYVFAKPGGGWVNDNTPLAALADSTAIAGDRLGYSVAISADGSTIVAGARGFNSFQGAAHVFIKPGIWWANLSTPTATLTKLGAMEGFIGESVAISADGTTIVAGAKGVDGVYQDTGAAYVFVKSPSWTTTDTPTARLSNSASAANSYLGRSVAIDADGSIIAVGADGVTGNTGAVYVFIKSVGSWVTSVTPDATLTNANGAANDCLGDAVAINADGSTIVAGARGVDYAIYADNGSAYVFGKPVSGWASSSTPSATLFAYSGFLGNSVAISADGTAIVAGAPGVNSSRGAGHIFYQWKLYLPLIMR